MPTIVLTGGGTAGHCTPNLALIPYLRKHFDKIFYFGSENGIERNIVEKENLPYFSIPCAKLNRSITLKNFTIPFKLFSGIINSGNILDKIKPAVVFSKGGYVAVPTVIAAKNRNIPVIAHESDFTIGLANKITSRYCKKVLTSFPETALSLKNGEYVGPPLRNELFNVNKNKALKLLGFNGQKPILLVTGGSLGAQKINNIIRESLDELLPNFDILHICGKNNLINSNTHKGYVQIEFLNDIQYAFAISDVCVTRAGSNTLFELMCLRKPCVLIPLPKGTSRGDQIFNANYFQKLGLATTLSQNILTKQSLVFAVNSIYANRFNLSRNFDKNPIHNASEKISSIISDYIR